MRIKRGKKIQIASDIIVRSCELLPKSDDVVSDCRLLQEECVSGIYCGSAMEFYIRPLNPCVTDNDILLYSTSELVFTTDFPVLPVDVSDLSDTIECYKFEPYLRYPGFVRIRTLGKLHYNWKCKKYDFSRTPTRDIGLRYFHLTPQLLTPATINFVTETLGALSESAHGPAMKVQSTSPTEPPYDQVHCVWCPQWPEEAQEWLIRRRDNEWPTIQTISEVVQQGCHSVYVQHRACRNDKLQWRLSFSVAEVILLQSWTPIQQIVYHMLRFFAKTEIIQTDCPKEDEVLCTYHLKTLMLWTCEKKSSEWWNSSSVIAISCELLKRLSECMKRQYCPNYFIRKANLFHVSAGSVILKRTVSRLSEYSNCGALCRWFVGKYIVPATRIFLNDENTTSLFKFRKSMNLRSMGYWYSVGLLLRYIPTRKIKISQRSLSSTCWKRNVQLSRKYVAVMSPFPLCGSCFTNFDTAVLILNAAHALEFGNILWDSKLFVDYTKEFFFKKDIVKCQFQIFPKPFTAEGSQIHLLRALDFMTNFNESDGHAKFQLMILISKDCLRKALECEDSQSNAIAPAALVYLAALQFASSENQAVIDLCSAVFIDETTNAENETLNAGCLSFIDDVSRIVGFCLAWKTFIENMHYTKGQICLDLRITPKVFARYLTVLSAERMSKRLELNHDPPTSTLPLDKFFMLLATQKSCASMASGVFHKVAKRCVYPRTDSFSAIAPLGLKPLILKEKLINALTEYALETMTSFYSGVSKDYGIKCNTADCYRALYLYKCRRYDEVLHLCERILKEPMLQNNFEERVLANVLLLPPLASFFDEDIQTLLGFQILCYDLSHVNNDMGTALHAKLKLSGGLKLFGLEAFFKENRLPNLLRCSFAMTYYYILGSHFLAKYLRLRCFVDCDRRPFIHVALLGDFGTMKIDLPFEQIIRNFLMPKLRKLILQKLRNFNIGQSQM